MADRFEEMARKAMESKLCIDAFCSYPKANSCGCYAALLDMYKAGQEAMRERAAVVAGTLAETTYDNEPEFSAVTDVEVAIRNLPIEES